MKGLYKLTIGTILSLAIIAIVFPGLNNPHEVTLDSGETVVAYENGTVYTGAEDGIFEQRTLWQDDDGSIMSNRSILAYRAYLVVPVPATPKETAIWHEAMDDTFYEGVLLVPDTSGSFMEGEDN